MPYQIKKTAVGATGQAIGTSVGRLVKKIQKVRYTVAQLFFDDRFSCICISFTPIINHTSGCVEGNVVFCSNMFCNVSLNFHVASQASIVYFA